VATFTTTDHAKRKNLEAMDVVTKLRIKWNVAEMSENIYFDSENGTQDIVGSCQGEVSAGRGMSIYPHWHGSRREIS
jgi:hypothetical protein